MARTQRVVMPHLDLDPEVHPAAQRLVEAVVRAVSDGALQDGDPMPSSRRLSTMHHLSRSSVVEAYATLCGIGVLTAEHGSGTRVAVGARELLIDQPPSPTPASGIAQGVEAMDLRVPGSGCDQALDLREWNRAWRDAVRPRPRDPRHPELIAQLGAHLRSFRGVAIGDNKLLLRPSSGAALADLAHGLGLRGAASRSSAPETHACSGTCSIWERGCTVCPSTNRACGFKHSSLT